MSIKKFKKRNKENRCAISNELFESEDDKIIENYNGIDVKIHKKFKRKN